MSIPDQEIVAHHHTQAEEQLLFQATILRNVTDSVIVTDLEGTIIYWNEGGQRVFGYSAEEMLGKTPTLLYPDRDAEQFAHDLEDILAGKDYVGEWLGRRKDGTPIWIDVKTTVLRNSEGEVNGFIGIAKDITARKQAEEASQQSEEKFRLLADSLPQIVWTVTPEGTIQYYNQRWYDYIGLPAGSLNPEEWIASVHPDDLVNVLVKWEEARLAGKPFEAEYRLKRADGIYRWHLGRSVPIKERDGTVGKWFGTATDITDHKEAEQRKDEFIGIASHELKTPITTLKAFTQLLKRRFEKQGAMEPVMFLTKMEEQTNRLIRLVNDLFDMSKIHAGRLDYAEEPIALDAFAHDIVETAQQAITTHTLTIHRASNECIVGDSDRLGQVFLNLITNAVKYSPQANNVDIHIATSQDMVMVSVQDYGVGIPKKHQSNIFDRFYRVYDARNKTFTGLGMGLYIANEIVKRHGGKITVESEEGKGSIFTVYLPLRKGVL